MAGFVFLLSLCCLAVTVVATGPLLPHAYHVKGNIYIPKSDIAEPFEAWVDTDKKMSRIDYYGDTHALVQFDEENSIAVVGVRRFTTKDDGKILVTWHDGKKYEATVILTGSEKLCEMRLKEIEKEDSENDSEEEAENGNKEEVDTKNEGEAKSRNKGEADIKNEGEANSRNKGEADIKSKEEAKNTETDSKPLKKQRKRKKVNVEEVEGKKKDTKICDENKNLKKKKKLSDVGNKDDGSGFELFVGRSPLKVVNSVGTLSNNDQDEVMVPRKVHKIVVDSSTPKRGEAPIHYVMGKMQDQPYDEVLDELLDIRKDINEMKRDEGTMYQQLRLDIKELNIKLDAFQKIAAVCLAREMKSSHKQYNREADTSMDTSASMVMPDVEGDDLEIATSVEVQSSQNKAVIINVEEESSSSDMVPMEELLTTAELTQIFVKSCSRKNFASCLVRRLFDINTRLRSNVNGRGKDRLDEKKIKYVRRKAFEFFPLTSGEKEVEEWSKCVAAIDESSRRLKKTLSKC